MIRQIVSFGGEYVKKRCDSKAIKHELFNVRRENKEPKIFAL